MRAEIDSLGERIAEHAAHIDAAMHLLLTDLRAFDKAGGWHIQGFNTCAHWLSWRVGWALGTAREHVRVATKLEELPRIDEALRKGEMSYAKVRAMTRVATQANEATLLEEAEHTTGQQLETICRKYALVQRHGTQANPNDDQDRRHIQRRDLADGMTQIIATLHPEEAAVVWAALERIAKEGCRRERPDEDVQVPAAIETGVPARTSDSLAMTSSTDTSGGINADVPAGMSDAYAMASSTDTSRGTRADVPARTSDSLAMASSTDTCTEPSTSDKAYDSNKLDAALRKRGIDRISPNHSTRKLQNQDGRKRRRYKRRWLVERVFAWFMRSRRLVTQLRTQGRELSRLPRARLREHLATAFLRCVLDILADARVLDLNKETPRSVPKATGMGFGVSREGYALEVDASRLHGWLFEPPQRCAPSRFAGDRQPRRPWSGGPVVCARSNRPSNKRRRRRETSTLELHSLGEPAGTHIGGLRPRARRERSAGLIKFQNANRRS